MTLTHVMHAQMGPQTLTRSRSNVSRARTRRPARGAHSMAHSDGNHVAEGAHPASGGAPFALSQSGLLASPFAAAAAAPSDISQASTDEPGAEDAAVDSAAVGQGLGEHASAAEPAAPVAPVYPTLRTSASARQEQDYAIVEAPESLRRPSNALPPQDEHAQPEAQQRAAGAGEDSRQQPEYLATRATSLHAGLHAVPPSIVASDIQLGSTARAQSGVETVAFPNSAGGAADATAGLERLRVSGARSGVGGIETAGSTPVSFSSAASS